MSKNRKKKRGDRGSIEEEIRSGKKSNMAVGVEDAIQTLGEENPEPNLLKIKNILIDIQMQLSTIVKENTEFKNELVYGNCTKPRPQRFTRFSDLQW